MRTVIAILFLTSCATQTTSTVEQHEVCLTCGDGDDSGGGGGMPISPTSPETGESSARSRTVICFAAGGQTEEATLMPQPNRCEICGEPTELPMEMCRECLADYHKRVSEPGPIHGKHVALWAARRARWYAERRAAKNARAAVEREGRKARR